MSDTHGEGWWQASDGQWYPPEQHPDFQAGATQPVETFQQPPTTAMPPALAPLARPLWAHRSDPCRPPGPPVGPPPGTPGAPGNNAKWIVVGVLAVAAVAIAAFLLLGGDSKKNTVAATSSSSPSSSSSSSSSSSKSSSSSSTRSSSSSSSSSGASAAAIQAKLLKASDVSPDFKDGTFTADNTSPSACGQPNVSSQVPPVVDVGSTATNAARTASFQEEVSTYKDAATTSHAFDLGKQSVSCTQGTTNNGGAITLSAPKDVSSDLNAADAIEVDFQSSGLTGQLIAVHTDTAIITFQFQAASGVDASTLPNALTIAKKGLQKLGLSRSTKPEEARG